MSTAQRGPEPCPDCQATGALRKIGKGSAFAFCRRCQGHGYLFPQIDLMPIVQDLHGRVKAMEGIVEGLHAHAMANSTELKSQTETIRKLQTNQRLLTEHAHRLLIEKEALLQALGQERLTELQRRGIPAFESADLDRAVREMNHQR